MHFLPKGAILAILKVSFLSRTGIYTVVRGTERGGQASGPEAESKGSAISIGWRCQPAGGQAPASPPPPPPPAVPHCQGINIM